MTENPWHDGPGARSPNPDKGWVLAEYTRTLLKPTKRSGVKHFVSGMMYA